MNKKSSNLFTELYSPKRLTARVASSPQIQMHYRNPHQIGHQ